MLRALVDSQTALDSVGNVAGLKNVVCVAAHSLLLAHSDRLAAEPALERHRHIPVTANQMRCPYLFEVEHR